MRRTESIIHSLSTLESVPTVQSQGLGSLSPLPKQKLQSPLIQPDISFDLRKAQPEELISLAKTAIAETRAFLGNPINFNLNSFRKNYREHSAHWLPIRAQRSAASEDRTEFSTIYNDLKELNPKKLKIELKKLNKKYSNNFSSALGVLPKLKRETNLKVRNSLTAKAYSEILPIYDLAFAERMKMIDDFKVGNCEEFGFKVVDNLKQDSFSYDTVVVHTYQNDKKNPTASKHDHVIALIGVDKLSFKPEEWGQNFVCVDAWVNDTYKFSDLNKPVETLKQTKLSFIKMRTRKNVRHAFEQGNVSVLHMRSAQQIS